ncbi:MAG: sterol desaturase family protein [Alphaproteobacteria bacterium]
MSVFFFGLVSGLLGWTLVEYVIHSVLGHLPKGRILTSREHLAHHADILYFTPLALKVRGAIPVLAAVMAGVGAGFGLAAGLGVTIGVATGWTVYEVVHQSIHVNGPRSAWSRWAARHHLDHHFRNPRANHGVTTPLWDVVLGTHVPVRRVRVPRRAVKSLPWLESALAADRAPGFLADYEVAG